MSAEQSSLLENASLLKDQIGNFVKKVMDAEDKWPEVYSNNPDEQYNRNMLHLVAYKLQDGLDILNHLCRPVQIEGSLVKSQSGRYTVPGLGYDLITACGIEILIDGVWQRSWIGYNGDYYIYGYPDLKLDGLHVRIK